MTAVAEFRLLSSVRDVLGKDAEDRNKANSREQFNSSGLLWISISVF